MSRFYEPDLGSESDSPFARDAQNKLVRRSYWLDMNDRSLVMVMTNGIGAHSTNDEKRAHLTDLECDHLIDRVCIQEIPPTRRVSVAVLIVTFLQLKTQFSFVKSTKAYLSQESA